MTVTHGKIAYRNVSCCCASREMCDCYDLKHIFPVSTVRVADSPALTEVELPGGNHSLIDEYVVVKLDNTAYPGIVTDEDHDDVEVKFIKSEISSHKK